MNTEVAGVHGDEATPASPRDCIFISSSRANCPMTSAAYAIISVGAIWGSAFGFKNVGQYVGRW